MGFSETLVLVILAYLLFGPKRLPEIARQVGKAMNDLKRASNEFKAQIATEISQLELETQRQALPPSEPPPGSIAALPVQAGTEDHGEPSQQVDPSHGNPSHVDLAPDSEAHPLMKGAPDA